MPSVLNELDLTDDAKHNIKMYYVSSQKDDVYEYLYLKGKVTGNLSLDDHLNVTVYNNANNLTSGYEVVHSDDQYRNAVGQNTTNPNLAYNAYSRSLNNDITDIRDIKHTTYLKHDRLIYLALRRSIAPVVEDQLAMKYIHCSGLITATNIGVSTQIIFEWMFIPLVE